MTTPHKEDHSGLNSSEVPPSAMARRLGDPGRDRAPDDGEGRMEPGVMPDGKGRGHVIAKAGAGGPKRRGPWGQGARFYVTNNAA